MGYLLCNTFDLHWRIEDVDLNRQRGGEVAVAVPGGQVVDASVSPACVVDGQHPVRVVRLKEGS